MLSGALMLTAHMGCSASSPCDAALRDGVQNHYASTTSIRQHSSLKSYLTSQSFRSDIRNGKFGAGVTLPVKGVPVTFDANSSEGSFNEATTSFTSMSEEEAERTFYHSVARSNVNLEFVKLYFNCVTANKPVGFTVTTTATADRVVFEIQFRNLVPSDPMPTVKRCSVFNASGELSGLMPVGSQILPSQLVSAARIHGRDMILELETDRGSVVHIEKAPPPPAPPPTTTTLPPPPPPYWPASVYEALDAWNKGKTYRISPGFHVNDRYGHVLMSNAGNASAWAEYSIISPEKCYYSMQVSYASADTRPVAITINGLQSATLLGSRLVGSRFPIKGWSLFRRDYCSKEEKTFCDSRPETEFRCHTSFDLR